MSRQLVRGWLHELGLRPGDLLLTGRRDPMSRIIQRFTRSPVSHAIVSLGGEDCIHAMDDPWQPRGNTGGVYRLTLDELASWPGLCTVIGRRPASMSPTALQDSATYFLENSPPFATTGLALAGMLVLLNQPVGWQLARMAVGEDTQLAILNRLGSIVDDGAHRVMCAELAYRVYARSGVQVDLDAPLLLKRMERYRVPASNRDHTRVLRLDARTRRHIGRSAHLGRRPQPLPSRRVGTDLARLLRAADDLRRMIDTHRFEGISGDIADLVMPSDLLRAMPFTELGRLTRSGGGWTSTS